MDSKWYLVQCKPREDERALAHLTRQGFACFWPTQQIKRRRQGQRVWVSEAFFPGYLFVRLDRLRDNWQVVRSTRGVWRIVRFGEYPQPVSDGIVEAIRERLAGTESQRPYLRPGDRVQISAGAFSHLEAIFVAEDGDERVVLLLNILQRDQELSFPVGCVRRVG